METDIAQISLRLLNEDRGFDFDYSSGHMSIIFSRSGNHGFEYMGRLAENALPAFSSYMMCMHMGDFQIRFFGSNEALVILDLPLKLMHQLVLEDELNISFSEHGYLKDHMIHKLSANNGRVETCLDQIVNANEQQLSSPLFIQSKKLELLSSFFETSDSRGKYECPFLNYQENVEKVREAKALLISDLKASPTIKELSRLVGLNESHLKSGFKEIYGKPIHQYFKSYKNEIAKRQLDEKEISINVLAGELGYTNVSHFIESFKKQFGLTPKQYQMKLKGLS